MVAEESDETLGWLEFIEAANLLRSPELSRLIAESRELAAIMSASYGTARYRERQGDNDQRPKRGSADQSNPPIPQSNPQSQSNPPIPQSNYPITRLPDPPSLVRPAATDRSTTRDHDPAYSFAPFIPACSSASRLWHAVTPDPQ